MMTALSDGQLVTRCCAGDIAAFEELVRRYRQQMIARAERRLGSYHDAEDVAQEAFLAAYFHLPQLLQADRFLPWLHSITDRCCLMQQRRRSEEAVDPLIIDEQGHAADQVEMVVSAQALAILPEKMRGAIMLVYLEGYTCEEAARLLHVSPGTVKSRLSRGKSLLRKEWGGMSEQRPDEQFSEEFMQKLLLRAQEAIAHGKLDDALETLEGALQSEFAQGESFNAEVVRMAEYVWEEIRRRDAAANALQYGKQLHELDWRVNKFNILAESLAGSGGEGRDVWGVPHEITFLDARDICRRLRVSPVTLYQWVQHGMPVIRYRPWVRFDFARVQQWLAEHSIDPKPEVTLDDAGSPLRVLFREVEARRLTAARAEQIFHALDLPSV